MLLRRLIVQDFGLFRGRNDLDLAPRVRYRQRRPVVLLGGKNGSGKTTLLDAIRLCLYGPLALGPRVSVREYEAYLNDRIHRANNRLVSPEGSSVEMEFLYAQTGVQHTYSVERRWERRGSGSIRADTTVLCDGKPLEELERAQADEFLRELIPPGVSQLFFFDGEKIQQLAETAHDQAALAEAVRGLTGLELLERLQADLRTYAAKNRDAAEKQPLRKQQDALDEERRGLEERLQAAIRELDDAQSVEDRCKQEIEREKQRLARMGGTFAAKREALEAEQTHLKEAIREAEAELRESCEGLLPFLLCSLLCHTLNQQLAAEGKIQQWMAHEATLKDRLADLKKAAKDMLFPANDSLDVSARARKTLVQRVGLLLDRLADQPEDLPSVTTLHRLSEDDRQRLLGAIHRVLHDMPQRLNRLQKRLERSTRRLQEVEGALKKIPADEITQPTVERLQILYQELGTAEAATKRAELDKREVELKLEDLGRRERKHAERLADLDKMENRRALLGKVQIVVDDLTEAQTTSKIQELRDAVVRCFGQLWRKGDLVRRIEIDPKTFHVTLFDAHDRPAPKDQLSAGEKQIYAISMLWALAQLSGRPLPIVIDTPLGRLDSDHRGYLVDRYFPNASHQVIVLSTDTEIDQASFKALSPSVSHAYHLRYDELEQCCLIEPGYFWGRAEKEVPDAAQ
jgi:DNA sulfur modification protein DndD